MQKSILNHLTIVGLCVVLLFQTIAMPSALAQSKVKTTPQAKSKDEKLEKKGSKTVQQQKVNADVALLVNHLMERHLAGYPGGKSELEERFSKNLATNKVSRAYLERKSARMKTATKTLFRQSKDKEVKTLTTRKAASPKIIKKFMMQNAPEPGPVIANPQPKPKPNRYGIYLNAIKSLRCADDVGIEPGCDREEPYVIWSCFAPGYTRTGVTDMISGSSGKGIKKDGEFMFTQDKFVLGSTNSFDPVNVQEPLVFVYQVMENDPKGPTRDDIKNALGFFVSTAMAIYTGDWKAVLTNPDTIKEIFDTVITLGEVFGDGGDDAYPIYNAFFNNQNLLDFTSGNDPMPVNVPNFETAGSFSKMQHFIVDIKVGSKTQWKLSYFIVRQ